MHGKHFRALGLVMGLMVLMAGVWAVEAQDASDIPHITIEATAEGYTVPGVMPEGVVQVTFENHSQAPFGPLLVRLNEGVTLEDLAALAKEGQEAGMEAISKGQLSLLGSVTIMPNKTVDVTFDFAPGTYVFANTASGDPSSFQPFTVADSEGEGASPPEADVEVGLVDFAFNVPIAIAAGPQLWHIQNLGHQLHEMVVAPLDDAMTAGEFNQALLGMLAGKPDDEGQGTQPVILWSMSPGEQIWITYDLKPGTYAVVCGLPDTSGSGHTHAELGMRQIVIVTQ
jgi:hypothetical protein